MALNTKETFPATTRVREHRECPVKRFENIIASDQENSRQNRQAQMSSLSLHKDKEEFCMTQTNIQKNRLSGMKQESSDKSLIESRPNFVRTSLSPSENYIQYMATKKVKAQTRTKMNQKTLYTRFGKGMKAKDDVVVLLPKEAKLVNEGSDALVMLSAVQS